jgi:TorA maturation chaperone TorD
MLSSIDSVREVNTGREVFYNFLSRSLKTEVDDAYLEMIVALLPYIENMTSQTDVVPLNTGGKLLKEFGNHLTGLNIGSKKEILLDLARDFAYLFLTGPKSVPTCESVYRSPEHLLKQGSYLEVLRIYNLAGFNVPVDFKEPEDHIAIQLKFMAVLSKGIGKAIDAANYGEASRLLEIQIKFFKEHLNKWIPQFCDMLISTAQERYFYQAIAELTKGFLVTDHDFISGEMSQMIQQIHAGVSR